jgi:hypothetical protein
VHAGAGGEPELDRAFLERVGLASEIDSWRAAAADYFARLGGATPARRAVNG